VYDDDRHTNLVVVAIIIVDEIIDCLSVVAVKGPGRGGRESMA